MATINPFDLLGDDENEDPSQLIASQLQKLAPASAAKKGSPRAQVEPAKPAAKLPAKPLPPAQAVREGRNEATRGGGRGGRGGRGFYRDSADNENAMGNNSGFSGGYRASQDGEGGRPSERRGFGGSRGGFRGGRRGGFSSNDEATEGDHPRRVFDRRSGTGRGSDIKREGAGRGNWGTPTDETPVETEEPVNERERNIEDEKKQDEAETGDASKESLVNEPEEKELEEKEMTLEEYEKVLEEKRKALLALKPEERKVNLDKDFESMQLLSNKKNDDDIFVKLGNDKDKRKEASEKAKKSVSINEFLKPAEGESYHRQGGRGRGRGLGRGRGGYNESSRDDVKAPSIEDVGHFPTLGSK